MAGSSDQKHGDAQFAARETTERLSAQRDRGKCKRSPRRGTVFQQVMSKPIMISTSFVCVLNILGITSEAGVKSSMITDLC